MTTEADARMVIDQLLRDAGWIITDKAQVSTEEATADGRADYLLKDTRTRPMAVIEAKRFSVDPYTAKRQPRAYAESLAAPFVILSNGQDHYFWDYEDSDARPIMGMPSQADLERRANLKIHRPGSLHESLATVPYPTRFMFRGEQIETRPYQNECLKRADSTLVAGRRRMLFEMATGTGKTLTIAMLMKRWFQAAVISRVLDLVVTDECHRSIYNIHRATLGHFDAVHIGLTATPNPGELRWVSEYERQLVRSTYMFFDCWDAAKKEGGPTFCYGIQQAINEGYLANYKIYQAESVLTFEGAEWEGDEIKPGEWGRTAESEDRLQTIIQEYFKADAERLKERPSTTILFGVSER